MALACLAILGRQGVDCCGASLQGSIPSPSRLPPVSLEPQELPSCSQGSLRVLALWEEVNETQKGTLEIVDQPGPGFYSCLFLMEKVTGGWRPVIDLSALSGLVTLTKFKMKTVVSVLGSIRKGD